MKHKRNVILSAVLIVIVAVVIGVVMFSSKNQGSTSGPCAERYRADKVLTVSNQKINLQQSTTEAEREQGLSDKKCITANQGMLFTFDAPGYYSFWMQNMKFPIDMVWVNNDKKVISMQQSVQPSTYPSTFVNKEIPAKYVIELAAGRSQSLGLGIGTNLNF